jgi:hypothetical protein
MHYYGTVALKIWNSPEYEVRHIAELTPLSQLTVAWWYLISGESWWVVEKSRKLCLVKYLGHQKDQCFVLPCCGSCLRFISVCCCAVHPKYTHTHTKHKVTWKTIIWEKYYHGLWSIMILTSDLVSTFPCVASNKDSIRQLQNSKCEICYQTKFFSSDWKLCYPCSRLRQAAIVLDMYLMVYVMPLLFWD